MKQTILPKALFLISTMALVVTQSIAATDCHKKSDGSLMGSGLSGLSVSQGCWAKPVYYGINFYEMRLCSSIPTAPTITTTFDLSNCQLVLSSPLGSLVEVQYGISNAIPGVITRPENGTYSHAYVKVGNIFKIKGDVDFGSSSNLSVAANRYCVSNAGSQTTASRVDGSCSATSGVTPGLVTTEKVSFDGGSSVTKTGARGTAYLLDSNEFLASDVTSAETDFVATVKELKSPVVFNNSVTNINITTTVKKGMTVKLKSGSRVQFDIGPFDMDIEVQ